MWQDKELQNDLSLSPQERYRKLRAVFEEARLSQKEKETFERKAFLLNNQIKLIDIHKFVWHPFVENPKEVWVFYFEANEVGPLSQWIREPIDSQIHLPFF